jgi:ABC-type nickel/cobalt efflux system permease component RcnA
MKPWTFSGTLLGRLLFDFSSLFSSSLGSFAIGLAPKWGGERTYTQTLTHTHTHTHTRTHTQTTRTHAHDRHTHTHTHTDDAHTRTHTHTLTRSARENH